MVNAGPLAPIHSDGTPVEARPDLTDDDVDWLNRQLAVLDHPPVRYVREPPPSTSLLLPSEPTGWITTTTVRG